MSDAAVETLPQGFIQQQFLNQLSIAHARKNLCVNCIKVDVKVFVYVSVCINVKVEVDLVKCFWL